jgi:hypothetical protein
VVLLLIDRSLAGTLPTADSVFADQTNETSKEQIEAEVEALEAMGEQSPAPVPENPEDAGPLPDPEDFSFDTGFLEDIEFPLHMGVSFVNGWQGEVSGSVVTLYAGSRAGQPERGIVLLRFRDPPATEAASAGHSKLRSQDLFVWRTPTDPRSSYPTRVARRSLSTSFLAGTSRERLRPPVRLASVWESCGDQYQSRDDQDDVQQHPSDRDGHIGTSFVTLCFSSKRRQHP